MQTLKIRDEKYEIGNAHILQMWYYTFSVDEIFCKKKSINLKEKLIICCHISIKILKSLTQCSFSDFQCLHCVFQIFLKTYKFQYWYGCVIDEVRDNWNISLLYLSFCLILNSFNKKRHKTKECSFILLILIELPSFLNIAVADMFLLAFQLFKCLLLQFCYLDIRS